MMILFNGRVGSRKYRILIVLVDGELHILRPYVGWYYSWPVQGCKVFDQQMIGEF